MLRITTVTRHLQFRFLCASRLDLLHSDALTCCNQFAAIDHTVCAPPDQLTSTPLADYIAVKLITTTFPCATMLLLFRRFLSVTTGLSVPATQIYQYVLTRDFLCPSRCWWRSRIKSMLDRPHLVADSVPEWLETKIALVRVHRPSRRSLDAYRRVLDQNRPFSDWSSCF